MKCYARAGGKQCLSDARWEHAWGENGILYTCDEHRHCSNCVQIKTIGCAKVDLLKDSKDNNVGG